MSHRRGKTTAPPTLHQSLPLDIVYPSNLPPRETLQLRENGWIMGPMDELILWLPLGLRNQIPFSQQKVIENIDLSNFKCGIEWTECRYGSTSSVQSRIT